jgi:hypothetical protein
VVALIVFVLVFVLMAVGVAVVAGVAVLLATSFPHQPAISLYLAPATFILGATLVYLLSYFFGGMTAARTGMISTGVFTGELITMGICSRRLLWSWLEVCLLISNDTVR